MGLFPYKTVREGQRQFMEDVRASIEDGKHLVAHAPTGIGKTAAVLAPGIEFSLKAGNTIFFLTPKHTQHIIVIDTLQKIRKRFDIHLVVVDIIGKQWMCPHRVRDLNSREFNEFCRTRKKDERCKYYNNVHNSRFMRRVRNVIGKIKSQPLHNEKILSLCAKHELCPYEICISAARDANVVVCDYFHIFSQKVREVFLKKLRKDIDGAIIVVDEAHNLPDRIRKLLSVNLTEYTLGMALREAKLLGYKNLGDDFEDMLAILKKLATGLESGGEKGIDKDDFLKPVIEKTHIECEDMVNDINELGDEVLDIPNKYRSYAKTVARFLERWAGKDFGYVRVLDRKKGICLSYRCLDPSIASADVFSSARCSQLMSGTLLPLNMYTDILGLDPERTIEKSYTSPFPRENRLMLLVPKVTTKYNKRSQEMYKRYAATIRAIIAEVPGNVAIFFPAYHIMNSIASELRRYKTGKRMITEKKEMKKQDRILLYDMLVNNKSSVLMGVQAGSFSEGMDYPENLLDAVVVVGLPLGKPDLEVNAIIDYYQLKFGRGWDYGYIFPAMNRALQAAGRCIRSETDRGAIILMDERFRWKNYAKCFPDDFEFVVTEMPQKYLENFFKS